MNRFKNWLRYKMVKFLGIDTLTNLFDKHIDNNDNAVRELNSLVYNLNSGTRKYLENKISHFQDSVNTLHNTVENVVHIGTDIDAKPDGRSWAVICIEGKINIVKFVDLRGQYTRDIMNYLKQFEAGQHCIDAPYKDLLYEEFFKF